MKNEKLKPADQELFLQAMRGVKPIKKRHSARVVPPTTKITKIVRKKNTISEIQAIILNEDNFTPCEAEERVFFVRTGLQQKVMRQLRQGKIPYEKILDLHALTIREAKLKLERFLGACLQQHVRSVLIIHGKGTAKLKSALVTWLKNYSEVLGFSSAQPKDGGAGAIYLLLRK